jgi:glycosyltransferase involved in cell wall biosynthesis
MKIVQINAVYEYSSTGRNTQEIHEFLIANGHESYVVAKNVQSQGNFIQLSDKQDSKLHGLMSHLMGRQGFYSKESTKQLVAKLKKIQPDVVHIGVVHSNCINLPILLSYLAENNIPTALTLHDCWFFTGHCCYFTDANCDRWRHSCGKCPELHTWNRSWFFDQTKRNLKDKQTLFGNIQRLAVIGVSDWVTNFVYDSILKDAQIIRRIYNWIDLNKFKPIVSDIRKKLGIENDMVVLCVAQTWGIQKGINDVKELAKRNPNFKFVLVGTLPLEFLPLPSNIVSVGVTSSVDELVAYYSMADVFFNPSTRETFGKVTAEAIACGTPVIAYNVTATPELIGEGCGYVVDPHDLLAVSEHLNTMYYNTKAAYTEQCRKFAKEIFSKDKLLNDHLELYKEISAI